MADTGSEVAEEGTRFAVGVTTRLLEHHFMWKRMQSRHQKEVDKLQGEIEQLKASQAPGQALDVTESNRPVSLTVHTMPAETSAVSHELSYMLDRATSSVSIHADPERDVVTVVVPEHGAAQALDALEELDATEGTTFSLASLDGLPALRAAAGRDAHSRGQDLTSKAHIDAQEVETSTLTFANHPKEPDIDLAHAKAYARGMRALGFDTKAGLVDNTPTVAITYPTSARDDFVRASAVCLHDADALKDLTKEDPFATDPEFLKSELERLTRTRTGHSIDTHTPTEPQARPQEALTAEQYLALSARDRSHISPERVPEGAYGKLRVADATAAARSATRDRSLEPTRTHAHAHDHNMPHRELVEVR